MKNTKERISSIGLVLGMLATVAGFILIFLASCSEDIKTIITFGASGCLLLLSVLVYCYMPDILSSIKQSIKAKCRRRQEYKEEQAQIIEAKMRKREKAVSDYYDFSDLARKYSRKDRV